MDESDNHFKPGDTVELKSGSPAMTVARAGYATDAHGDGDVLCVWFSSEKLERAWFWAATLRAR